MGQTKRLRKSLAKLLQGKKSPVSQMVLIQHGVLEVDGKPGPEYKKISDEGKKK